MITPDTIPARGERQVSSSLTFREFALGIQKKLHAQQPVRRPVLRERLTGPPCSARPRPAPHTTLTSGRKFRRDARAQRAGPGPAEAQAEPAQILLSKPRGGARGGASPPALTA